MTSKAQRPPEKMVRLPDGSLPRHTPVFVPAPSKHARDLWCAVLYPAATAYASQPGQRDPIAGAPVAVKCTATVLASPRASTSSMCMW